MMAAELAASGQEVDLMAKVLSGSFDTKPIINSRYLTFSWTATQDYEKNETTISWVLKCNGTATTYNKAAPFSVVIDGEEVFYYDERIQLFVGDVVASSTKTLSHNSDGSRSFSASVKAAIYAFENNVSGSGTWQLADIPRSAVMTKVPATFTDEDSPTIEFTNYLGNSVDSVSVCLSLDNYYSTIPYRAVGKTDTSYTFEFTDEEKAKIYEYTKNTKSLKVSFYIKTVVDGVVMPLSKLFSTLKIEEDAAKPIIDSFTVEETSTTDLTGSASKMIVEHNRISASATYTLQKGAELDYIEIMNHKGELFTNSSAEFVDAISPIFEVYIRDSRGYENYATVELEAIDYIPLTCTVEAEINLGETDSSTAEITYRITGNWFNGSFGAVDNTLRAEISLKGDNGGAAGRIVALTGDYLKNNTYDATFTQGNISYKESWVVEARIIDATGKYVISTSKKLTALPIFDWSKEDFNFNVKINSQKSICFPSGTEGIRATNSDGDEIIALQPSNNNDNLVLGFGNYNIEKGATNIYGNSINMYTKKGITIDGIKYNNSQILWSGENYPVASHTLYFKYSDGIAAKASEQPNGIVLVFSSYTVGTGANDWDFQSFFIPKAAIAAIPGKGYTFVLASSKFEKIATKYIYISDTHITGNDANDDTGTAASGIKYTNNAYVLRYIIGV